MRTTLDLDEDILLAVKDAAARERISVGQMMSRIVRKAMAPKTGRSRNGVLVFTPRADAPVLTLDTINRLRDEE